MGYFKIYEEENMDIPEKLPVMKLLKSIMECNFKN